MSECTLTHQKRRSKEYKQYINNVINDYNTNGKKTVLLACDAYFPVVDGVVNVIDNYAKLLSQKMNVMMLVPTYKGEVYMNGYPAIGITSGFSKRLRNQVPMPMFDSFQRKLLKKLRIDVMHSHSPFTVGKVALRLHKRRKIPLVNTFHSQYKRDFENLSKAIVPLMMNFILDSYKGSDEVWTMHTASRDTLLSYGYKGDVVLMPNATSLLPASNYQTERSTVREKYLSDENELLLIFVGRIFASKNIFFIVDVLAELKKRGLPFKMIFAGDGPDKDKLEKKIEQQGLTDETILLGQIDRTEIAQIYSAADLFLFPSMYDVSSLVQIEAASRYTPTVFAEGSVTSCTVTNGVNGYIFPCEVKAFADGVYQAVTEKDKLKNVSNNAYNDLYINWQQIIDSVYQRYINLIENNKKTS